MKLWRKLCPTGSNTPRMFDWLLSPIKRLLRRPSKRAQKQPLSPEADRLSAPTDRQGIPVQTADFLAINAAFDEGLHRLVGEARRDSQPEFTTYQPDVIDAEFVVVDVADDDRPPASE